MPGTARADIAIIKRLTDKPIRYLVNTHWHYDHTNGNAVYRSAFPGLSIIAHPETRRLIELNTPRYLASVLAESSSVRNSIANSRKMLADLDAKHETKDRDVYQSRLAQRELELAEMTQVAVELPDLLVPHERTFELGGREVVIRHLGRANTPGDVIVYLPRERIVATGDIVVSPMPYGYNSNPASWIGVLDSIIALNPVVLVPGHGEVQRTLEYARDVRDMLADIVAKVGVAYRRGKTVDDARATIDFAKYRRRFAGDDAFLLQVFDSSIKAALVDRAWVEAQGG